MFALGPPSVVPTDVRLMLAAGDSVSLAWAEGGLPLEYLGHGFSVGGDPDATTLFSLFRDAGANVSGASVGTRWHDVLQPARVCSDREAAEHCRLNGAVDGARVADIGRQLEYLETQMARLYPSSAHQWKVLTLFVGLSDAAFAADPAGGPTPVARFEDAYAETLRRIGRWNATFVNTLLLPVNASAFLRVARGSVECSAVETLMHTPSFPWKWTDSHTWAATLGGYNAAIGRVAARQNGARTHATDPYFAVQRFMERFVPERAGVDTLDCFHPNAATRRAMAVALWNNMVGPKAESFSPRS